MPKKKIEVNEENLNNSVEELNNELFCQEGEITEEI